MPVAYSFSAWNYKCAKSKKIFFISSQIISTIVVNLTPDGKPPPTLYSSAKIKPALFEKEPRRKWRAGGQLSGSEMSEGEVIFREGEFLSGRKELQEGGGSNVQDGSDSRLC